MIQTDLSTLHGLTLDQLEAIRGYSDTATALDRIEPHALTLTGESSLVEIGRVSTGAKVILAAAEPSREGPYADGVRFALEQPTFGERLNRIKDLVRGAIAARRTMMDWSSR